MSVVIKPSVECFQNVCAIGYGKTVVELKNNIFTAFLAGAYIALGGLLAIRVAGNMPVEIWGNITRLVFGGVFPVGLLLVLVAGGDLFTGNCMYMSAAVMNKKTRLGGLLRSGAVSWRGKLRGAGCVAYFLGYVAGTFFAVQNGRLPLAEYAVKLANDKCALDFDVAFVKGIGCNWLVCLAIYMSLSAGDGISKVALIWPPVTAFVALGYEHSVANMAFIPLGIFLGSSDIYLNHAAGLVPLTATWSDFLITNLLPVTLGNIVGGGVFVSLFYWKAWGLKPNGDK